MKKTAIILFFLLIILISVVKFFNLNTYFTFEYIVTNANYFKQFVSQHYAISVIIFVFCYLLLTGFSFPGAAPLTMLAGFLFGVFTGTVLVNIGATCGATGAFLLTRYVAGKDLQKKYSNQLRTFNRNIKENGIYYLLVVRLVPIFPFFLINILAGLTTISVQTFLWTTSLGIIPGSIAYVFAGKELQNVQSPQGVFTSNMLLVVIILGILLLLPVIFKKCKLFP